MTQAQLTDPVDERLCLAIYRASHAVTATYRQVLAPLGLTYTQYMVMSLLWQDGPTSVAGIGRRLGLESSTLSPLLQRLETQALVDRRRSETDEREVIISLTETGRRLKRRAKSVPAQVQAATGLSRTAEQRLTKALNEMTGRLLAA